jgi:hypothetical protein
MPISTINQNGLTNPLTSLASNTIQVSTGGSASAPVITKSDDTNTGMFFPAADTIAFTEGGTESMRITSAGNVLVGGTSDPSGFGGCLVVKTNGGWVATQSGSTGNFGTLDNQPMAMYTNQAERMRIDSSGNTMIGTTTSGGRLTVSTATGSYVTRFITEGNNQDYIAFVSGSNIVGSVSRVGGSNVAYNTSSDYRLKENVAPMTGALAKVAQLKPCSWTWKLDGSAGQGFIAHELQAIIPDAVTGEKDGEQMQGVDTSYLVATLTAAIQELKAEFDAYKASHP